MKWGLFFLAPIAILGAFVVYIYVVFEGRPIRKDKLRKLHSGMTKVEVGAVLGLPPENQRDKDIWMYYNSWSWNVVHLMFNEEDQLITIELDD